MGYDKRKELFEKWQSIRKRPIIAYVTSIRPNLSANMSSDAIAEIINTIDLIPEEIREIDFMVISNGGDPITSLRIMSILRERFDKITVVVPYVAYSAATILALGADEIMMHPFSNLGPVDPQLTILKPNMIGQKSDIHFSSEDIRNYVEFLREDVGITDQVHLASAIANLSSEVGTIPIGSAKRSQQLSLSLSKRMLKMHLDNENVISDIAKKLNSSFYHHGYAVSRSEAQEIGLTIMLPNEEEKSLMWRMWKDYSEEMCTDNEFNIINELMKNEDARKRINEIPVIELPANTPIEIANQLMGQVASQIPLTSKSAIEMDMLLATIESLDIAYEIKNHFSIIYWRNADMTLGVNATPSSEGWKVRE